MAKGAKSVGLGTAPSVPLSLAIAHRPIDKLVRRRNTVAKPEWGTKIICPSCGAKFYDLKRDPAPCPKCETPVSAKPVVKPRAPAPAKPKPPVPPAKVAKPLDDEDAVEVDDDADLEDVLDDDDEDDDVIEDTSDLGDDDDDLGEVKEHIEVSDDKI